LDFSMPMRVGRYIPCFLGFVSIFHCLPSFNCT
jgi:hypothetical protein